MDDNRGTIDDGPIEAGDSREPMPIWFFVGLILTVYGVLVVAAGAVTEHPAHIVRVTELAPGIWWGGLMTAGGLAFLVAGLKGRGS